MFLFETDRRVLVLALARMADAVGNSFLIVVLPLFIASGQVPLTGIAGEQVAGITLTEPLLIGIVLSLFGFLNSFGQPFTGQLSDRSGKRKRWILFGLALLGVASAGMVLATSYWTIVSLRALQGVGAAFTIPATVALVNELATDTDRGGNFGVFNTFRLIGFGFGPLIAGAVVHAFSFDAAFGVAVVGAFLSFALVTVFVSDPETTRAAAAQDLSIAVRGDGQLFDPVFALGLATVTNGIGIALFTTLVAPINAALGQGATMAGLQIGAVTLANVVFQIPVGRGSDLYGRRPFLLGGMLLLIPTTLAQGYVVLLPDLWGQLGMVAVRFLQGTAVAMVFAPSMAVAGDLAEEGESGTTLSVLTMAFGLGIAIGPLASGALVAFGFATPFVVGAVLAALALVIVYTQVEETVHPEELVSPWSPSGG